CIALLVYHSAHIFEQQNPHPNPKWRKPKNHFPKGGGKWFLSVAGIKNLEPKNRPQRRRFGFLL
ncbi:hypothetical protein KC952_04500, partial [Candidatus Saccharibacteria bacterium]|nr:hypothetical protein [Candidatus Saccharibacteria bacterium]